MQQIKQVFRRTRLSEEWKAIGILRKRIDITPR